MGARIADLGLRNHRSQARQASANTARPVWRNCADLISCKRLLRPTRTTSTPVRRLTHSGNNTAARTLVPRAAADAVPSSPICKVIGQYLYYSPSEVLTTPAAHSISRVAASESALGGERSFYVRDLRHLRAASGGVTSLRIGSHCPLREGTRPPSPLAPQCARTCRLGNQIGCGNLLSRGRTLPPLVFAHACVIQLELAWSAESPGALGVHGARARSAGLHVRRSGAGSWRKGRGVHGARHDRGLLRSRDGGPHGRQVPTEEVFA